MSGGTACFIVLVLLLGLVLFAVIALFNDADGGWLLVFAVALSLILCRTIFVHHEAMLEHLGDTDQPHCTVCGKLIEEE